MSNVILALVAVVALAAMAWLVAVRHDDDSIHVPEPDHDTPRTRSELALKLHRMAVARGRTAVGWYQRKRALKKRLGVSLRLGAILFTAAAGLHPLVFRVGAGVGTAPTWAPGWMADPVAPAILLAVAALLILLDRFGDMTNGWIRYMRAEMTIDQALAIYVAGWTSDLGTAPDPDVSVGTFQRLQERSLDMIREVDRVVRDETGRWAAEFRKVLDETERAADEARRRLEGGSLEVELTNWSDLPDGRWHLQVRDRSARLVRGARAASAELGPGRVRVRGWAQLEDGTLLEDERIAEIRTGVTEQVRLTLPKPPGGGGGGSGGGGTESRADGRAGAGAPGADAGVPTNGETKEAVSVMPVPDEGPDLVGIDAETPLDPPSRLSGTAAGLGDSAGQGPAGSPARTARDDADGEKE